MLSEYIVPNVSPEFIMDVAKILANSAMPMSDQDIKQCFARCYSSQYINSAITACLQIGLASEQNGLYIGAERFREDVKLSAKDELYIPFQNCLKNYAPFLLYVDFLSKGYDSKEAVARTKGILRIRTSIETVEKSLRRWGLYSKLIDIDKQTGKIDLKIEIEKFTTEYVMKLQKAFEAELKTKLFIIDMLGEEVFAYLDQKQIVLDDLASALLNYENDSKGASSKATRTFELFLWRLAEDSNVNLISANGIIEIADSLRAQRIILANHCHISHAIGGIRNITHHDPEKETGRTWNISKQGALLTTLLVSAAIRSIFLYAKNRKQEF
ncbi:MAG: hypothetical protein QXO75_04900 [Nitrososphaerota archaeon]